MKYRETDDSLVIDPPTGPLTLPDGKPHPWQPPPRMPPPNGQRFDPGPAGPCICSEAAPALDKVTGLCVKCWRVLALGGR